MQPQETILGKFAKKSYSGPIQAFRNSPMVPKKPRGRRKTTKKT